MIDQLILSNLAEMATKVEAGWFWATLCPGIRVLVREGHDCHHASCLKAGKLHRHYPTPEERDDMQAYVRAYQDLKTRHEMEQARAQLDVAELERLHALPDYHA